jgi:hypothetical protein
MPGENNEEELFSKHFEAAGIEPDASEGQGEENGDQGQQSQDKQEQSKTEGSEQKTDDKKVEGDQGQGDAAKDSSGKSGDSGKKQGEKEEGKDAGNPGDLKLPDGTVVKAGPERRHFESWQFEKSRRISAQNELNTEKQRAANLEKELNTVKDTLKQLNVGDPTQVSSAIRLYRDLSSNPVGTVKTLLAELKAMGHTIDGIGSGVDTNAINMILEEKLKGLQPSASQEDFGKIAQDETVAFLTKYPDAATHEFELAQLVEKNPNMSLEEIYFGLRQAVIDNGLDWSKPLQPQVQARKSAMNTQDQQPQGGQQPPLPNGHGGGGGPTQSFDERDVLKTPARGESSDDIIRAAMREANLIRS